MAGSAFSAGQSLLGQFGGMNIPVNLQHRFNFQTRMPQELGQPGYASSNIPSMVTTNTNPFLANNIPHSHSPQINSVAVNLDINSGIQQDSDSGFLSEANVNGLLTQEVQDENQNADNDFSEHRPDHAHTHAQGQNQNTIRPEWKLMTYSGIFILILFLRLMSDHILGLLIFLALAGTFYFTNQKLQQQVHYSSLRNRNYGSLSLYTLWTVVFLTVNTGAIYYVFREQKLWKVLVFVLPPVWEPNVWMLLWVVVITDFILKFVTVILKSLITMLPAFCILEKRKGIYFMLMEHTMQMYRSLLPILPWVHFLLDEQTSGKWLFGSFLLLVYGLVKLYLMWTKAKDIKNALMRLRVDSTYGTKPTPEQLQARGENCPICQDDYEEPVMLNCKHTFCENCVAVWFNREKTCPMCRAQVHTEIPAWRDGSSSGHIQWY